MMTSADIYAIMKVQYILMRRVYKKNDQTSEKCRAYRDGDTCAIFARLHRNSRAALRDVHIRLCDAWKIRNNRDKYI